MSQFVKGMAKIGGRTAGSRNKYSKKFDDDLRAVYDERGIDAASCLRGRKPNPVSTIV
jgi:hypothetical protein